MAAPTAQSRRVPRAASRRATRPPSSRGNAFPDRASPSPSDRTELTRYIVDMSRAVVNGGARFELRSVLQVRQHRQDAAMVGRRLRQVQLRQDALNVLLDGADRQYQRLRDPRVRATLRHQAEHFALARRQALNRVVAAATREQRGYDVRVERRPAARNAPYGLDELRHVHHAVLQQVADAA